MKLFRVGAWIAGTAALLIMLAGAASMLAGRGLFGIRHFVNYFHVANSLLLFAILLVLLHKNNKK